MGLPGYLLTSLGQGKGVGDQCLVPTASGGDQSACIQVVRTRQKVLREVSFSGSRIFFPPFTVKLEQSGENGTGVSNQEPGLLTQLSLGALRE